MCHGIINRKSIDCVILYFIIEVLFIRQKAYGSTPCESSFLLTIDHRFIVTFSVYVRVCVNMFLHHVCSMISFVRQKLDIVLRNTGGRAKLKLYVSLHSGERVLIEVVVEVVCIFRNFNQSHLQNQYKTVTKRKKNRTHGERRQK